MTAVAAALSKALDFDLHEISDSADGRKLMETHICVFAVNYFNDDDMRTWLRAIPWGEPESVQLLIMRQDWDKFDNFWIFRKDEYRPHTDEDRL